jgi:hypothetical protein
MINIFTGLKVMRISTYVFRGKISLNSFGSEHPSIGRTALSSRSEIHVESGRVGPADPCFVSRYSSSLAW